MSRPEIRGDRLINKGRFRLQKQILDTAGMVEFIADEIASDGTNARQVALTMFQFDIQDEVREALAASMSLLKGMAFRTFPAIREIDREQERGLLVISDYWKAPKDYWKAPRPLSEIIDDARNNRVGPDLTFALYVLKTMCSAVSLLHECRVSDFKTIHGAISPQTVWIDSGGTLRCRNHFFGLALAYQQGHSLEDAHDVRGLGELFWSLVSYEPWRGAEQASKCSSETRRILEASGLLPGFGRSTVSEFSNVVDEVLASGPYCATQKYASHWLVPRRLPSGPVVIRKKNRPSQPPQARVEPRKVGKSERRLVLAWMVGIIVLTMAAVFGIVLFLVKR